MRDGELWVNLVLDTEFSGARISTFEVNVPLHTWVHLLTHRMFSRNAQSNRAIPTARLLERASYTPNVFRRNRRGMKGGDVFTGVEDTEVRQLWNQAKAAAHGFAKVAQALGVHKELANRLLAPFMFVRGLVTATEWDNFFALRCDSATQDETRAVAITMREFLNDNEPLTSEVHFPYVDSVVEGSFAESAMLSAARCARVSYLNHDGRHDDVKDMELAERLLRDGHLSPFEHPCLWTGAPVSANLRGGWTSFREHMRKTED